MLYKTLKDELLSRGEDGVFYGLNSTSGRMQGSVMVRMGIHQVEKGYRWFLEVLPSKPTPVIHQGEEATAEAAFGCLNRYLRMSQSYLDEAVAELASFPRNPEGLN